MASKANYRAWLKSAETEYDQLTQWMGSPGFRDAPKPVQNFADSSCQVLLSDIAHCRAMLPKGLGDL